MKLFLQFSLSGIVLFGLMQSSLAVQASGSIQPNTAVVSSAGVIERGGTIEAINTRNKILIVDGIKYTLSVKLLPTHNAALTDSGNNTVLKVGMKIRFITSKYNYSAQEQVDQVWSVGSAQK